MQHMCRAVFVGRSTHALVQTEYQILEGLDRFEEFVNAGVEAARVILHPPVARRANQRTRADAGADEQRQPKANGGANAEIVSAVWRKVEFQPFTHRCPVEEVRLVERGDLSSC